MRIVIVGCFEGCVGRLCSQWQCVRDAVLVNKLTSKDRQWSRCYVGLLPKLRGTTAPLMAMGQCWLAFFEAAVCCCDEVLLPSSGYGKLGICLEAAR